MISSSKKTAKRRKADIQQELQGHTPDVQSGPMRASSPTGRTVPVVILMQLKINRRSPMRRVQVRSCRSLVAQTYIASECVFFACQGSPSS